MRAVGAATGDGAAAAVRWSGFPEGDATMTRRGLLIPFGLALAFAALPAVAAFGFQDFGGGSAGQASEPFTAITTTEDYGPGVGTRDDVPLAKSAPASDCPDDAGVSAVS